MTALDEYPAELTLTKPFGQYILTITSPDLHGTAASSSREMVMAVAEAYAAMRRKARAS